MTANCQSRRQRGELILRPSDCLVEFHRRSSIVFQKGGREMVALNNSSGDDYSRGWHDGWTDGYETREELSTKLTPQAGREVVVAAAMIALSSGMVGFLLGVALR